MRRGLHRGRAQGPPRGRRKKGRPGRRRRLKGAPGRGTLGEEKPPIFGMIQRSGEVMNPDAGGRQAEDDRPPDQADDHTGGGVYTDDQDIYARFPEWGYTHPEVVGYFFRITTPQLPGAKRTL